MACFKLVQSFTYPGKEEESKPGLSVRKLIGSSLVELGEGVVVTVLNKDNLRVENSGNGPQRIIVGNIATRKGSPPTRFKYINYIRIVNPGEPLQIEGKSIALLAEEADQGPTPAGKIIAYQKRG